MTNYTPTAVGYHCAAMMRYRPESADSKRIEIYPTDQWGLLGDYPSGSGPAYNGPENAGIVSARSCLSKLHMARSRNDRACPLLQHGKETT